MNHAKIKATRRHVFIYDEDWEFLQLIYGQGSTNKIGASEAVRRLVHKGCVRLRQKQQDAEDSAQDYHEEGDARPEVDLG